MVEGTFSALNERLTLFVFEIIPDLHILLT